MKLSLYHLIVIYLVQSSTCQEFHVLGRPHKFIMRDVPATTHTAEVSNSSSSCTYQVDHRFGGTLVNCSNRNMYHIVTDWIPANTTTALFNSNYIKDLPPNLSTVVPNIVFLSLNDNQLANSSMLKALSHLVKLQILDLDSNCLDLDQHAWKEPYFENMTDLKDLKLGFNNNGQGKYPDFLLKGLKNLQHLNLDTFLKTLEFGSIFNHTPNLRTLLLSGRCSNISNTSFHSLEKVPLEELYLFDLQSLLHLESNAFVYLTSLHTLKIQKVKLGINPLLSSLSPFQRRNFSSIEFVCTSFVGPTFTKLSILNETSSRFLKNICLERLVLVKNKVIFFSRGFLTRSTLSKCLKQVIVRLNPLKGDAVAAIGILAMSNLEVLEISDIKYSLFNQKGPSDSSCLPAQYSFPQRDIMFQMTNNSHFSGSPEREKRPSGESMPRLRLAPIHTLTRDASRKPNKCNVYKPFISLRRNVLSSTIVFINPSLRVMRCFAMEKYLTKIDRDYRITGNKILKEIIINDNGIKFLSGHVMGLDQLEVFDISSNDAWKIPLDFFDYFPRLRYLNISNSNLNPFLMASNSQRLFRPLNQLLTLDVSKNNLIKLSPDTFDTLGDLLILNLAGNNFKHLPVNLNFLPKLNTLDLSENSIELLSESSRTTLDQRVKIQGHQFSLILSGNILSCRCNSIRFLAWLRRTSVKLDGDGNYTCMNEAGLLSFTDSTRNLDGMWRKCIGWTSLMISLFLACLAILAYTSFFLCVKFKTRFVAFFLEMAQRIHGPENYAIGVFIGYADSDAAVIRFLVAEYIETVLGFTTYIRHRDLDPGKTMVDSIVHAIHSSWRVLILVSHDFLTNDEWAWFTMQAAIFSVEKVNPRRVVVLVEEPLRNRIPHCLLTAVHEDNIVSIENRLRMTYEERLRLKYALQ